MGVRYCADGCHFAGSDVAELDTTRSAPGAENARDQGRARQMGRHEQMDFRGRRARKRWVGRARADSDNANAARVEARLEERRYGYELPEGEWLACDSSDWRRRQWRRGFDEFDCRASGETERRDSARAHQLPACRHLERHAPNEKRRIQLWRH